MTNKPKHTPTDDFNPPYKMCEHGLRILTTKDEHVLDIRGWGRLTGKGHGGLGLPHDKAEAIQREFGANVVKACNSHAMLVDALEMAKKDLREIENITYALQSNDLTDGERVTLAYKAYDQYNKPCMMRINKALKQVEE